MEKITIFCDGASKGNPGPGGWGAIVGTEEIIQEMGGRDEHTTNNKMELRAALEALVLASAFGPLPIEVHTDSSYVINGITKWVKGWKKNGWMTKDKKDVSNQDLWMALDEVVSHTQGKITWTYVGGHVGIAGNERVDEIASNYALNKNVDLYNGPRAGYEIDIVNLGHSAERKETKSKSSARSKAKAYSYVSLVDGKVLVHKTWAECEARVKGKMARFKKALSAEEEAELIREFSN